MKKVGTSVRPALLLLLLLRLAAVSRTGTHICNGALQRQQRNLIASTAVGIAPVTIVQQLPCRVQGALCSPPRTPLGTPPVVQLLSSHWALL
jgi:hypothetical protein